MPYPREDTERPPVSLESCKEKLTEQQHKEQIAYVPLDEYLKVFHIAQVAVGKWGLLEDYTDKLEAQLKKAGLL